MKVPHARKGKVVCQIKINGDKTDSKFVAWSRGFAFIYCSPEAIVLQKGLIT
jgi:hypothetical protein